MKYNNVPPKITNLCEKMLDMFLGEDLGDCMGATLILLGNIIFTIDASDDYTDECCEAIKAHVKMLRELKKDFDVNR